MEVISLAAVLQRVGIVMSEHETDDPGLSAIREVIAIVQASRTKAGKRPNARAEILARAINVFADRGLERTTVQHLLDAASVSRRTFYKHFRNKYDVLESLYEICVAHIILRFRREAERGESIRGVIERTVDIYFDYHISLGPIIRLMMEEARRIGSVLWPHREQAYATAVKVLQTEMERVGGRRYSPLVFKTIVWSLESYSLHLLAEGCPEGELEQCKKVMTGVAEALLVHGESPWLLEEGKQAEAALSDTTDTP